MRVILNDIELTDVEINSEKLLSLAQEALANYVATKGDDPDDDPDVFGVMLEYLFELREPWDEFLGNVFSDIVNIANDYSYYFECSCEDPDDHETSRLTMFVEIADSLHEERIRK